LKIVLEKRPRDSRELRKAKDFLTDRWASVSDSEKEKWGAPKLAAGRRKGVLQESSLKLIEAIAQNDVLSRKKRLLDKEIFFKHGLSANAGSVFRRDHALQIAATTARIHGIHPRI
jgi:hypothetical protein